MRTHRGPLVSSLALVAAACGEAPPPEEAAPTTAEAPAPAAAPERRVEIVSPAEGDTVAGPTVTVRLAAFGFAVVPAGDTTANSGHHHLFLDRDLSAAGQPIPAEAGRIAHLGTGASELVFEPVEPGEHLLIAVVGDHVHVPIEPPLTDTVRFIVR